MSFLTYRDAASTIWSTLEDTSSDALRESRSPKTLSAMFLQVFTEHVTEFQLFRTRSEMGRFKWGIKKNAHQISSFE